MAKRKEITITEPKYLVHNGYYDAVDTYDNLENAIRDLRAQAENEDSELEDYLADQDIAIYEVKQTLVVEEEVKRTLKINGQIVSL